MKIVFDCKPLTVNQYKRPTKTGRIVKTGKAHAYDEYINMCLDEVEDQLGDFDCLGSKQYLELQINWFQSDFFNKDGSINKTAGDWDNIIKPVQDLIFSRFKVLNDAFVKTGHVSVIPSNEDSFEIIIKKLRGI